MENQKPLLKKIEDLSEAEKLELFKVEELEDRLEMTALTDSIDAAAGSNGVCWVGDAGCSTK
ncbi:hypothetical protein [Parachryseolinea silvisoli]|jgi:hypothetical protein|uniref:hypothetical protein n=1 Tax=Parachryseolinea silvisoli TaxID=2873601 RepID=UPI002265F0C5|nr:hypothetical protein [Parachryseolinea silvisoli]MCD9019439.1 hypothetical protein [Parachryseolinea silvisoli]